MYFNNLLIVFLWWYRFIFFTFCSRSPNVHQNNISTFNTTYMETSYLSHLNTNKSNCKVWVDGKVLCQCMSCSNAMDGILLVTNGSILKHNHLLCKHGIDLHPRIARQGEALTVSEYTAYASLLCGKRALR